MNIGFNFLKISDFLFILKGKLGKQKTSVSVKKAPISGHLMWWHLFDKRSICQTHVKLDPCAFSFLSKEVEPLNFVVLVEMQIHGCAQCSLKINGSLLNTSKCEILWKDLQDADVLPIPLPWPWGTDTQPLPSEQAINLTCNLIEWNGVNPCWITKC